jgi:lysozyme family protein
MYVRLWCEDTCLYVERIVTMWKEYFKLLMKFEGTVYEHDKDDPGGETKFGIDRRSHPDVDIRNLTLEQAEKIYLKELASSWAINLPEPLRYVVFDMIVNSGSTAAAKALQRAVGVGIVDGKVGPNTKAQVKWYLEEFGQAALIERFTEERDNHYRNIAKRKPMDKYLKGWLKRSSTLEAWALKQLAPAT